MLMTLIQQTFLLIKRKKLFHTFSEKIKYFRGKTKIAQPKKEEKEEKRRKTTNEIYRKRI
jgi:hypothetical protein